MTDHIGGIFSKELQNFQVFLTIFVNTRQTLDKDTESVQYKWPFFCQSPTQTLSVRAGAVLKFLLPPKADYCIKMPVYIDLKCFDFSYLFLPHWPPEKDGNWHERSALQSVAVRRSTGNDDSGPLFSPLLARSAAL